VADQSKVVVPFDPENTQYANDATAFAARRLARIEWPGAVFSAVAAALRAPDNRSGCIELAKMLFADDVRATLEGLMRDCPMDDVPDDLATQYAGLDEFMADVEVPALVTDLWEAFGVPDVGAVRVNSEGDALEFGADIGPDTVWFPVPVFVMIRAGGRASFIIAAVAYTRPQPSFLLIQYDDGQPLPWRLARAKHEPNLVWAFHKITGEAPPKRVDAVMGGWRDRIPWASLGRDTPPLIELGESS